MPKNISFSPYIDYLNLILSSIDPMFASLGSEHNFDTQRNIKLLPYTILNENGYFYEALALEARYFKKFSLMNFIALDILQDSTFNFTITNQTLDQHLLYLVSFRDEYHEKHSQKTKNFLSSVNINFRQNYYKHYYNTTNEDVYFEFKENFHRLLNTFFLIYSKNNLELEFEQIDKTDAKRIKNIIKLFSNESKTNAICEKLFNIFSDNKSLLLNIFDLIDIPNDKYFEENLISPEFIKNFHTNMNLYLEQSEKVLNSFTDEDYQFFNDISLFFDFSSIIFNNNGYDDENSKTHSVIKHILDTYSIKAFQVFDKLFSPIKNNKTNLSKEKINFINSYTNSINIIENEYNKIGSSLLDDKLININELKQILPQILTEIDSIASHANDFHLLPLNEQSHNEFIKSFKENLFSGLVHNKVQEDIFYNLHKTYPNLIREIDLHKKITQLDLNNSETKPSIKRKI